MRVVIGFAVLSLAACGGVVESTPVASDAGAPAVVPTFGTGGVTEHAPVACEPCATNASCGTLQAACVASAGAPFCAPGCSKDGFCPSDRTCTWVDDPTGQPWRACMPAANPCATLDLRPYPAGWR